jgi:hypothetical protein
MSVWLPKNSTEGCWGGYLKVNFQGKTVFKSQFSEENDSTKEPIAPRTNLEYPTEKRLSGLAARGNRYFSLPSLEACFTPPSSLSLSRSHSRTLSLTLSRSHALTLALSLALSHAPTLALSLSRSHALTLSPPESPHPSLPAAC